MLALPVHIAYDLPSVPPFDKEATSVLVVLLYCFLRQGKRIRKAKPFRGIDLLIVISMLAAVGTAKTNPDALSYGSWKTIHIKGLEMRDSLSLALRDLAKFGLPFFMGRMLFRTTEDLVNLLKGFAVAGAYFSLACLVEIRLSPQIHTWIYQYAPHSNFAQTIRWGGFRPMVCTPHGLAVAMFMTAATISAAVLVKSKERLTRFKLSPRTLTLYLGVILVACKSTGAILYAFIFVPIAYKAKSKSILRAAVFLAVVVAVYPTMRAYDVHSHEKIGGVRQIGLWRGAGAIDGVQI